MHGLVVSELCYKLLMFTCICSARNAAKDPKTFQIFLFIGDPHHHQVVLHLDLGDGGLHVQSHGLPVGQALITVLQLDQGGSGVHLQNLLVISSTR